MDGVLVIRLLYILATAAAAAAAAAAATQATSASHIVSGSVQYTHYYTYQHTLLCATAA
jgi:hypothetical protein